MRYKIPLLLFFLIILSSFVYSIPEEGLYSFQFNSGSNTTAYDNWNNYNGAIITSAISNIYPTYNISGDGSPYSIYNIATGHVSSAYNWTTATKSTSVCIFFKSSDVGNNYLFGTARTSSLNYFLKIQADGSLYAQVREQTGVSYCNFDPTYTVADNKWHSVCLIVEESGTGRIIFDGFNIFNASCTGVNTFSSNYPISYGALNDNGVIGSKIIANIDNIQVFNKSLNSTEWLNYYYYGDIEYIPVSIIPMNITFINPTSGTYNTTQLEYTFTTQAHNYSLDCQLNQNDTIINTQNTIIANTNRTILINYSDSLEAYYTYFINCTDQLGNLANSTARNVYIDNNNPDIISTLQTEEQITFNILTGQTNYTDTNLNYINYSIDNNLIYEEFTSSYNYILNVSYNATNLSGGTHTLKFCANDSINSHCITSTFYKAIANLTSITTINAGGEYARNLNYTVSVNCPNQLQNSSLRLRIGTTTTQWYNFTCDNTTHLYSFAKQPTTEGIKQTWLYLFSNYTTNFNIKIFNRSITYDLYAPSVESELLYNTGFLVTTSNITMRCTDTIFTPLTYNLTYNNINYMYKNLTNNTYITNATSLIYGMNNLSASCSDLFSTNTSTIRQEIFSTQIILIDERNNTYFDIQNITSVIVYFDDNSSNYDFKAGATAGVNFTSDASDKLRFEFVYNDGGIVTRYIDVSLISGDVRICANREGVTHNPQTIISASSKPVVLKSVYSNCLVTADYTRFAYQDALSLKAYTIDTLYYLYVTDGGEQTFLASFDGSYETYIDIDTLEFNKQAYNINIKGSAVSFTDLSDANQTEIFYINLDNDNQNLHLLIQNTESGTTVLNTEDFLNKNNFTLYFDYSSLDVNSSTLFKLTLTETKNDGTNQTTIKYFNIKGSSGGLSTFLGVIISLMIVLFTLTLTIVRETFSWFGLMGVIGAIVILIFTQGAWYVTFLQAIYLVVGIYIVLIMTSKNYQTVG